MLGSVVVEESEIKSAGSSHALGGSRESKLL